MPMLHRSTTITTITSINPLVLLQLISFLCFPWTNQIFDLSQRTTAAPTILTSALTPSIHPTLAQQRRLPQAPSLTTRFSSSSSSSFIKSFHGMSARDSVQSSTTVGATHSPQSLDESLNTYSSNDRKTQSNQKNHDNSNIIDWVVRPATLDDEDAVTELLQLSYKTLLTKDYDSKILEDALPIITQPRPELLTCGTWYVVEDPKNHPRGGGGLVGCGGWTRENPAPKKVDSSTSTTSTVHLRHFATHPDWVRKGVGRAIWHQICQDLSLAPTTTTTTYSTKTTSLADSKEDLTATMTTTMLEVYSTLTGQAFYESLGFRVVEPMYISVPLSNNCKFPSILMKREWSA